MGLGKWSWLSKIKKLRGWSRAGQHVSIIGPVYLHGKLRGSSWLTASDQPSSSCWSHLGSKPGGWKISLCLPPSLSLAVTLPFIKINRSLKNNNNKEQKSAGRLDWRDSRYWRVKNLHLAKGLNLILMATGQHGGLWWELCFRSIWCQMENQYGKRDELGDWGRHPSKKW